MTPQSGDPRSLFHVKPGWTEAIEDGLVVLIRVRYSAEEVWVARMFERLEPQMGAFREWASAALDREMVASTRALDRHFQ